MKIILIFGLLTFSFTLIVYSQDTIVKRNGEEIRCIVKEIGTSEIKYIIEEINPEVSYSIFKKEVDMIIFSNGKVQKFEFDSELTETIEKNSMDLFLVQKKNALKIDFLSLVTNATNLTYEKCLKPGRSLEFTVGAVGIGFAEQDNNASGVLFRGGYKLMRSPDHYLQGIRYAHILKGPYIKFEFDFASYGIEGHKELTSGREKYTLTKWALLIVLGKQWVFNDSFAVDLYSGLGVGKNNLEELDWTYPYGFSTFGSKFPLAMSFGLRCGFLIK